MQWDGWITVALSFLGGVAVVEDALSVVGPGQAAELDPFQDVRQLGEPLRLQEAQGDPV